MSAELDKLAFYELAAIPGCDYIAIEYSKAYEDERSFRVNAGGGVGCDVGNSIADASIALLERKAKALFDEIEELERNRFVINMALAHIKNAKKLEDEKFEAAKKAAKDLNAYNPKIAGSRDD